MSVLAGLKPERVFYYFEELCRIPHGSGNTKEVSDYLVQFARDHELSWYQDASNNVVIRRPASKGCELAPTVILQGHCDMVCEKKPGSSHDFTKDGLELHIDGDEIYARDTTLGGDDGIAVAYMLAVLESDDLQLPAIEALITTDEEIGLLGAAALNGNELKGRTLLNMDSEEEGILTVSCAGGMTAMMDLPVRRSEVMGEQMEVTISGLAGGHSGTEIHKNRANSNILAGRFLYELAGKMDYALIEFNLLIGLNGYTVCSGVIDENLNGKDIIAVPLADESEMRIGYITHKKGRRSSIGVAYLECLKKYLE